MMKLDTYLGLDSRIYDIVVITDNVEAAKSLGPAFKRHGQNYRICSYDGQRIAGDLNTQPDGILFLLTDYVEHAETIKTSLLAHFKINAIPSLGILYRQSDFLKTDIFNTIIYAPAHPEQITQRMLSLLRLERIEREIRTRIMTYQQDYNIECDYDLNQIKDNLNILFVGKASPAFMAMINIFSDQNVDVTGAFSSYSAFNYLHEKSFDAVIMNTTGSTESALLMLKTMRRNSRLYGIPVIFLVDDMPENIEQIYNHGVHDVILVESDDREVKGRIMEAANFHRISSYMKTALLNMKYEGSIDEKTNLFTKKFFLKHLDRVCKICDAEQKTVSMIIMQIRPNAVDEISAQNIVDAENQIGNMLSLLTRREDISARISNDTFAIAIPEQNVKLLEPILTRIRSIIDCAAFDSGSFENANPFTMSVEAISLSKMPHETAEQFLTTALAELVGDVYVSNPSFEFDKTA